MQVSYGPHSKVRISSNKSMVKINVLKFGPLSELKKGLGLWVTNSTVRSTVIEPLSNRDVINYL